MAHLTCVEHGRRSLVTHAWVELDWLPKGTGLQSRYVILHRGDRESCTGRVRFGKVEFSTMVAARGNLREVLNGATRFIETATPKEWRPRKTRRAPRR